MTFEALRVFRAKLKDNTDKPFLTGKWKQAKHLMLLLGKGLSP